ncbi:MAG: hypothetical protein IJG36_11360, partial [Synergistaceae bacterium]|nr:hypothetical protein [Synergistaceae bacterium]
MKKSNFLIFVVFVMLIAFSVMSSGCGGSGGSDVVIPNQTGNQTDNQNNNNTPTSNDQSGTNNNTVTSADYSSTTGGTHALSLTDGSSATYSNITVTKTGDISGQDDDYDWKGTNAAVLASGGSKL